ncbi:unnamed protein product [Angiostrongylus costaricensis]|uniref:MPN domain-containing protein n=1 Tax=Angiostrongylus costaricensis TaxID=334426 RepID=A0A158PF39_ANGCS|nr:unnamed protein product [Angiostrongylus costaricensis]
MNPVDFPSDGELITAIATCHSLTKIHGELHGDPLDLILFNKTGWAMMETVDDREESEMQLYDNVQVQVDLYAQHGYRLIAVARKALELSYAKASKVPHNMVENDLTLLGLVALENRVKSVTKGVINQLNRCKATGTDLELCARISYPNLLFSLKAAPCSKKTVDGDSVSVDVGKKHSLESSYQLSISGPTFAIVTHHYP